MKDKDGDFNRYSPHYDPDENRASMSIDADGSWVHITRVRELAKELERLTNERNQYRHLANLLLQAEEGYELRHVAEKQREACVQAAKNWARTQEQVAADKEGDSIWASAEMHRAESIMARRIAQAIQAAPLVTEAKS